ncbi:hypothetical protein GCM10025857_06740 [Alicyclobacillus contaminans]|nr:hypothetical protein GCM10025857_06740 [Alicyclobacillus contaminans]
MIEFCAETYGWTPRTAWDRISWASIVDLLEARADRMAEQERVNAQNADFLKPMGENTWGIGVR